MYHNRVTSNPRSVEAIISSQRGLAATKHQIHRRFAVFIRQREPVARGLLLRRLCGGAGVHQILRHAPIHQQNALARHPFPVEWRAKLQRMIGVIHDANILAKDLLADAVVKARPFVSQRRGSEVVKEKPHDIEHRRGFEDHGVAPRRKLLRIRRPMRLFTSSFGKLLRIKVAHVCGVSLGPASRRLLLHRDGKLRMRFAIRGKKPARIPDGRLRLTARENSRRDLPAFYGKVTSSPHGPRAIVRRERRCRSRETVDLPITLFPRNRQQVRIFRLAMRQRKRRVDRTSQRIFIDAIGRSPRRSPIHNGAHGNSEPVLGDVLMNRVVGETRKRVIDFIDVYFGFIRSGRFRQTQNTVDNSPQLALVKESGRARRSSASFARRSFPGRAHDLENAAPILIFRNREGEAPWPVPIVCIGCPLPQFGVPHKTHSSAPQIASHEFQNSVVIPL